MADDLLILAGRPGWTLVGSAAVYRPVVGGWSARVVRLVVPGRGAYARFHVAIIDPRGLARHTYQASTVPEAARVAEGRVGRPA